MKNNLENQDIKTDKPLAMSYEDLKAERDTQQKRADALAVENVEMRAVIDAAVAVADNSSGIAGWHLNGEIAGWDEILPELDIETPVTDAELAAIEARVWAEAKDFTKSMLASDSADCIDFLFDGKIQQLREAK